MNQLNLLNNVPQRVTWAKDDIVFSLSFDQDKILRDIMRLYTDGMPFDVDPTYSKGVFYKRIPQPRLKFDIDPQYPDVVKASADCLPLDDESVQSINFDPPFMFSNSVRNLGKIKGRFTSFASYSEMLNMYQGAMREFWRILKPEGIVVFKCQDAISQGINHFSHYEVEKFARDIGYNEIDLFVLGSKHVLISSTWKVQRHARKNMSFIFVFEKPNGRRRRR